MASFRAVRSYTFTYLSSAYPLRIPALTVLVARAAGPRLIEVFDLEKNLPKFIGENTLPLLNILAIMWQ